MIHISPKAGFGFAKLSFGAFAFADVGRDAIPLENVTVLVTERNRVMQEPAVFAIAGSLYPGFALERLAGRERGTPLLQVGGDVVGVKRHPPTSA
jgi:hypothetical protein